MEQWKVRVVSAVVGLDGILSAVFAFAAEATRVKECEHPSQPAGGLSLASAVCLIVAFAVIHIKTGCLCCEKPEHLPEGRWRLAARICFIFSLQILLAAAALNAHRGTERVHRGEYCYLPKPGLASAGCILSLASIALGLFSFVTFSSSASPPTQTLPQNQGIGLGTPQIPPRMATPVFVHEDTYNRQQFP